MLCLQGHGDASPNQHCLLWPEAAFPLIACLKWQAFATYLEAWIQSIHKYK